jgi:hypothetical protein
MLRAAHARVRSQGEEELSREEAAFADSTLGQSVGDLRQHATHASTSRDASFF